MLCIAWNSRGSTSTVGKSTRANKMRDESEKMRPHLRISRNAVFHTTELSAAAFSNPKEAESSYAVRERKNQCVMRKTLPSEPPRIFCLCNVPRFSFSFFTSLHSSGFLSRLSPFRIRYKHHLYVVSARNGLSCDRESCLKRWNINILPFYIIHLCNWLREWFGPCNDELSSPIPLHQFDRARATNRITKTLSETKYKNK